MNKIVSIFCLLILCYNFSFAQLSGKKICIDPGHGGFNSNDRNVVPDPGVNFWESESNFRIALFLKQLLEERGAWVILTRTSNDTTGYNNSDPDEPSLTARWQLANTNNVDWFHSIHSNALATTNTGTNYTLLLVKEDITTRQPAFPTAVTMSNFIGPQMKAHNRTSASYTYLDYTFYGGSNGGFNLGVLSGLTMPGELSEGSFHDYYPETRRLMNQDYRKVDAYGIRDGFKQYFNDPADPLSIIAGIQKNKTTGLPQNGASIRLLPENLTVVTDNYNNGYYKFDKLSPGNKTVVFESVGGDTIRINVNITTPGLFFADLKPEFFATPFITDSQPMNNDTSFALNNFIGIKFSLDMDTSSVRNAFSISPNIPGTISWLTLSTFVFTPSSSLPANTNFTLIVTDSAKSYFGIKLNGDNDTIPGGNYVLRFKTTYITSVKDNSNELRDYTLYQNYPNPFNPSTTISYSIAKSGNVSLIIYDILGKEVASLVNEFKSQGKYSVNFDASKLSSSIYLYRLKVNDFMATKKMVLVK